MFKQEEDLVLFVAGICSSFAVVISSLLIRRHLVHFSRPVVQVRYCGLLFYIFSPQQLRAQLPAVLYVLPDCQCYLLWRLWHSFARPSYCLMFTDRL